jgi:hypothetical protein
MFAKRRIILFGVSKTARALLNRLPADAEAPFFVETERSAIGKRFCGRAVRPASLLKSLTYDQIWITSDRSYESYEHLIRLGVNPRKIHSALMSEKNRRKLESLINSRPSERCVVVGNGRSLTTEVLQLLARSKVPAIAVDKAYLAFPKSPWRPDYYLLSDQLMMQNVRWHLAGLSTFPKLLSERLSPHVDGDAQTIFFGQSSRRSETVEDTAFDPLKLPFHQSTLLTATEVAFALGYKVVGLLAAEPDFEANPDGEDGVGIRIAGNHPRHFDPFYFQPGERYSAVDPAEAGKVLKSLRTRAQTEGRELLEIGREPRLPDLPLKSPEEFLVTEAGPQDTEAKSRHPDTSSEQKTLLEIN